jgi:hypothetical protein
VIKRQLPHDFKATNLFPSPPRHHLDCHSPPVVVATGYPAPRPKNEQKRALKIAQHNTQLARPRSHSCASLGALVLLLFLAQFLQ